MAEPGILIARPDGVIPVPGAVPIPAAFVRHVDQLADTLSAPSNPGRKVSAPTDTPAQDP